MGGLPERRLLLALPILAALTGCQGDLRGSGSGRYAGAANGGTSGIDGAGGGVTLPPDTQAAALLPTRIRRLTNAEYENSVRDVVGNTDPVTKEFVPDARQSGFTVNDAQRVDSVLIKQIAGAATILAAQVRSNSKTLAPCDPTMQPEACAAAFIQSFATRAYRRPLGDDEAAKLLVLYHAGADGAAYEDGIEEVATGVLQSAAFLYLTETGNAAAGSTINLTPYEIAAQMSYLLTAGPPSQGLLDAAAKGQLAQPEGRANAINTLGLLQGTPALDRVTRIIREWLGTDQLENTAKDSNAYPDFASLKPAMVAETTSFINDIVSPLPSGVPVPPDKGTLHQLLYADWTSTADQNLLGLYDAGDKNPQGFYTLPTRRGILNQGAFLSVYAHASETAPVLRGVALMRRITCIGVPSPATLNITVVPLVPDTTKTMRVRLNAHVSDPVCAGCHVSIDSFGFPFEIYDGMGKHQTADQNTRTPAAPDGLPIDSAVDITTPYADLNGHFADSNDLAQTLAESAQVRECFARNIFRASSGRSDNGVQMSEDDFVKFWNTQSSAASGDLINTILAYIASPTFTIRRTQ